MLLHSFAQGGCACPVQCGSAPPNHSISELLTQDVAGSDALAPHVHSVGIHQLAAALNVLHLGRGVHADYLLSSAA